MTAQSVPTPPAGPPEGGCAEAGAFFAPLREAPLGPRGRAARFGPDALTDREILTAILDRGDGPRAEAASTALIVRHRTLAAILSADLAQLHMCLEPQAALDLKLAHELAVRAAREKLARRDVLSNWHDLVAFLRARTAGRSREIVTVLYLDKRNQLIADEQLGDGTVDWAPMRPREVVRRALELGAAFLAISHNHPTGDPTPSRADIALTTELITAAGALGITVHDHVIIGEGSEVSMKQKGLI